MGGEYDVATVEHSHSAELIDLNADGRQPRKARPYVCDYRANWP